MKFQKWQGLLSSCEVCVKALNNELNSWHRAWKPSPFSQTVYFTVIQAIKAVLCRCWFWGSWGCPKATRFCGSRVSGSPCAQPWPVARPLALGCTWTWNIWARKSPAVFLLASVRCIRALLGGVFLYFLLVFEVQEYFGCRKDALKTFGPESKWGNSLRGIQGGDTEKCLCVKWSAPHLSKLQDLN